MTHLPRCGPTGRWLVATSLLAVAACSSDRNPTAPRNRPEFAISDAAHQGGTPGFFFLPPLVAQPTTGGAFDADIATLNPQVAICDITLGPDADCGGSSEGATPAIVVYTSTSTPAITVVPTASTYSVNWDTKLEGFVTGHTYRLHVAAGEIGTRRELGFADVWLTPTPGLVKDVATGDLIALNDGRTLPIRFRIERGIPGSVAVSAATASLPTEGTDLIRATLRDLHGGPLVGSTVAWSVTADVGVAGSPPLDVTSGQTDATGETATTFKAGTAPGTAAVTAASAGISASASVTVTANVVTKALYVANTGGNSITVFAVGATGDAVPTAVIAGSDTRLDSPVAVTLDASGNIYVANFDITVPSITVYAPGASGNAVPKAVIAGPATGLCDPFALAVDAAGTLYVANHCANSITVYAPGADGDVAPAAAIVGANTGLSSPSGVALGASGRIYVTNQGDLFGENASVEIFSSGASGNTTPMTRIAGGSTGLIAPAGIALDAAGNIYVPNANASPADITVYGAAADGDVVPTSTIITRVVGGIPDLAFVFGFPIGIAVDGAGNVDVASFGNHSVVVYAAGASGVATPLTVIAGGNTGLSALCGLAF